jgi:hypothetical protein
MTALNIKHIKRIDISLQIRKFSASEVQKVNI